MEGATAAHCPLEIEIASRRQSATTRVWGSIGSAGFFAEGTAHSSHNDKMGRALMHCAGIARYRQGVRGGRLAKLGVAVCGREWSAAPRSGTIPLQREVITHAHPHTHTHAPIHTYTRREREGHTHTLGPRTPGETFCLHSLLWTVFLPLGRERAGGLQDYPGDGICGGRKHYEDVGV
jgi:hypothetical protein